ncbi:hypothetical protein BP00DRAFT_492516 [Aspergillus indologenus CBS 114.80]|uniref:Uncharacterized protein n=1 Tax=Aspergillus indologenus CBS 114.80 TaxID=1450541 RepID=A0A2V5JA67_9EURO|nr:hypothetical protein BP00DRAFT_492516 [Aspergillus indologenus CBS 114.80]
MQIRAVMLQRPKPIVVFKLDTPYLLSLNRVLWILSELANIIRMIVNSCTPLLCYGEPGPSRKPRITIENTQDSSGRPRGQPIAHSNFRDTQTINSANYAYLFAQNRLSALQGQCADEASVDKLLNLQRGQGLDLPWSDTLAVSVRITIYRRWC